MSAARVGEWHLLDHDDDPVPAKASGLDVVIKHYKEIADMMHTQAALLKKIGDGDETLLKGDSADAMRERARKSNEALGKAAGRYDDVHAAIKAYQPELRTARSETGKALEEAEAADKARTSAEAMSDPVNEDRGDDAPALTDDDKAASRDRTNAINGAKGDLEAARTRANRAMEALDAAAEAAKTKIKENWGDDGLNHSWQEEAYYGFMKFLKGLVEVLGWIGMALAVVAMIIPGLQGLAVAALVVGGVALLGSVVLAATGEESWMGVVFGVIGILTAGVGKLVSKVIGKAVQNAKGVAQTAKISKVNETAELKKISKFWGKNSEGNVAHIFSLKRQWSAEFKIFMNTGKMGDVAAAIKKPSQFEWDIFSAFGLGGIKQLNSIRQSISGLNIIGMSAPGISRWTYAAGSVNWLVGFGAGAWSTGVPASSFGDDLRENYVGTADWEYAHFKTPYHGQLEEVE